MYLREYPCNLLTREDVTMIMRAITLLLFSATLAVADDDNWQEQNESQRRDILQINVGSEILQRAAELSMPLRVKGVQKTPIGNMKWIAVITNPKIKIEDEIASFVADVLVDGGVIKLKQKITGRLQPRYIRKANRIIVKPVDVIFKVDSNPGPLQALGNINLNDSMPDIEIPVNLPPPVFKVNKKMIKVLVDPKFAFIENALLITTPVKLIGSKRDKTR